MEPIKDPLPLPLKEAIDKCVGTNDRVGLSLDPPVKPILGPEPEFVWLHKRISELSNAVLHKTISMDWSADKDFLNRNLQTLSAWCDEIIRHIDCLIGKLKKEQANK